MNEEGSLTIPASGKGQQTVDIGPARRIVGRFRLADIVHTQAQMIGGIKTLRRGNHVLGRQEGDQMRGPMAFQRIAKTGQGADQETGHGAQDSTLDI